MSLLCCLVPVGNRSALVAAPPYGIPGTLIRSNWGEFVVKLDKLFDEPDMAQAFECTLGSLKMQENHHINKFMIEFAEHTTFTGWNNVALYSEFY